MNILQLISSSGFFGAENVVVQLLSQLVKDTPYSLSLGLINNLYNPHTEIADHCKELPVKIVNFTCKNKIDPQTILQIRRFLISNRIDIVHSHGYKSNLFAFLATVATKTSLIATCHNWLGNDSKMKFYALLDRLILRCFTQVVGVSREVEKKFWPVTSRPRKSNLYSMESRQKNLKITAKSFEH